MKNHLHRITIYNIQCTNILLCSILLYLPVSLSHAFSVRAFYILFDDLFPPSPAQPSPKEALHFFDLTHFDGVLHIESGLIGEYETVLGLSSRVRTHPTIERASSGPSIRRQWPQFLL